MNREILFRGKRVDNGEWVEGYYCGKVNKTFFSPAEDSAQIIDKDLYWHEVIPETVGQYTGLTDKNGKKIFEGDILSYIDNDDDVQYISVVFEECAFLIEDSGITDSDLLTGYVCLGLTVVANIHDNPELLEVHNGTENADSMRQMWQ